MAARGKSPKPTEAAAPVFDLSQYREQRRYVWREIEREGDRPLRVKLLRLNLREVQEIPYKPSTPMAEVYQAIAPYVVDWDFQAVNLTTGETVDVPPPSEIGPGVFELMENTIGNEIATWLLLPQIKQTALQKKDSTSSESGEPPPSEAI